MTEAIINKITDFIFNHIPTEFIYREEQSSDKALTNITQKYTLVGTTSADYSALDSSLFPFVSIYNQECLKASVFASINARKAIRYKYNKSFFKKSTKMHSYSLLLSAQSLFSFEGSPRVEKE